jgi:hypothetical protein
MAFYVEAEPLRPLPGGASEDPLDVLASPLVERLRAAYLQRAEQFQRAYCNGIGISLATGARLPSSACKVVPFATEEGEADEILIDEDLFATLLFVYVCEGWPAIERIEAFLGGQVRKLLDSWETIYRAAEDPWSVSLQFFLFVRNMLAVLIRDALIEIEQLAAAAIAGRLAISSDELDKTLHRYDIRPDPFGSFDVGNRDQLATLTTPLADAVAARVKYDNAVAALVAARKRTDEIQRIPMGQSRPDNVPTADQMAALTSCQERVREEALALYNQARGRLAAKEPMALIAVEGLTEPVRDVDLPEHFVYPLWTMHEQISDITAAVKRQRSWAAEALPGLPQPPSAAGPRDIITPIDPTAVQRLYLPIGPELAVINTALARLDGDYGMLSLLHEQTWRLLIASEDVAVDSMTYVVMHHYLRTLAARQAELEQEREKNAAYFRAFSRAASALSAALLYTPFAEAAPVLEGVSWLANAALLAYTVHHVVAQLSEYDSLTASRLVAPDAVGLAGLAAVGELIVARTEFAIAMTETLMGEMLALAAGGLWPAVKTALIARGFCQDMVTVFGLDEDGG